MAAAWIVPRARWESKEGRRPVRTEKEYLPHLGTRVGVWGGEKQKQGRLGTFQVLRKLNAREARDESFSMVPGTAAAAANTTQEVGAR